VAHVKEFYQNLHGGTEQICNNLIKTSDFSVYNWVEDPPRYEAGVLINSKGF
jgi:hypothetical protein